MLDRPIFVVGHPRSGTSLMRGLLERSDRVWTVGREGKPIWERRLHPRHRGWESNALDATDATDEIVAELTGALLAAARRPGADWSVEDKLDFLDFLSAQGVDPYYYDVPTDALDSRFGGAATSGPPTTRDGGELDEITPFCFPPRGARPTGDEFAAGIRLVEKSIQSCFRIPFLRRSFPDAKYVFVVREPKTSIASLMQAWLHPRMFFSYLVPAELDIAGYSDMYPWGTSWWNLSLPPGWRDLCGLPLAELCALNWRVHNEWILRALSDLPSDDAVCVRYEDLCAEPTKTMAAVAEVVDLPIGDAWRDGHLPVVMTPTPPDPDKWRRHEKEIVPTLRHVRDVADAFDYSYR